MKNLLALLGFAVLVFAAAGWYLEWYQLTTTPTPGGRHAVTLDLNTPKIGQDLQDGTSKVVKLLNSEEQDQNNNSAKNTQTQQSKQSSGQAPFEISEDGFFVLPDDLASAPKK